jgi:hypothetical protein
MNLDAGGTTLEGMSIFSEERLRKLSVSLPSSLVKALERRAGTGGVSAILFEAAEQWVAMAKH